MKTAEQIENTSKKSELIDADIRSIVLRILVLIVKLTINLIETVAPIVFYFGLAAIVPLVAALSYLGATQTLMPRFDPAGEFICTKIVYYFALSAMYMGFRSVLSNFGIGNLRDEVESLYQKCINNTEEEE